MKQHKQSRGGRKTVTPKKTSEWTFDQCEGPCFGRKVCLHAGRRMYGINKVIFWVSIAQSELENCFHFTRFKRVLKTVKSEEESNANCSRRREKTV